MKLLIAGGVAGGASAAARARRLAEDASIVLFERGPDVSFANCGLPYYVGGEIAERNKLLVVTPELLRSRFRLDGGDSGSDRFGGDSRGRLGGDSGETRGRGDSGSDRFRISWGENSLTLPDCRLAVSEAHQ